MTGVWRLRAAVLVLVGMLALHHGRYVFATAEHEHELAAVHRYLPWLASASGVLLFLAVVQLVAYVAREDADPGPELPRGRTLWAAATGTLIAVFVVQESLETLLTHGHLPALAELLGAGGWSALPLAVAIAGLIALLLRGAATVLQWALGRRRPVIRRAPSARLAPRRPRLAVARSVLARRLAGRGPPAVSVSN
jgi:hypothetical protein